MKTNKMSLAEFAAKTVIATEKQIAILGGKPKPISKPKPKPQPSGPIAVPTGGPGSQPRPKFWDDDVD